MINATFDIGFEGFRYLSRIVKVIGLQNDLTETSGDREGFTAHHESRSVAFIFSIPEYLGFLESESHRSMSFFPPAVRLCFHFPLWRSGKSYRSLISSTSAHLITSTDINDSQNTYGFNSMHSTPC